MQRLLVVEDDPAVRTTVVTFLELEGYAVDAVSSTGEALERLSENSYPIVISDIYIDDRTGMDVLDAARNKDPECSVILMTARGTMETVMAATRGGAFDYVAKPFEIDRMLDTIKRAEAARQDKDEGSRPGRSAGKRNDRQLRRAWWRFTRPFRAWRPPMRRC